MTGSPAEQAWPDKNEFMAEFNEELARGSDRALWLVAGAMTEELLRRLLEAALPIALDTLFEGNNAPLGSWSSRSSVIRALGLISGDDYRRLNLLRKMRNEMAHRLSLTLSDPAFVGRVRGLWEGIQHTGIPDDNRFKFGAAGLYLITMLSVRIAEVKRSPPIHVLFP